MLNFFSSFVSWFIVPVMAERAGPVVEVTGSSKSPVLDAKPAEDENGPRRADGISGLC